MPLRTVTTVIPQLRILGAAAVDSRAGNKALFSMRTFQEWANVEAAANLWAARFTWQLVKHGVQRKPGAPELPEPSEKRRF